MENDTETENEQENDKENDTIQYSLLTLIMILKLKPKAFSRVAPLESLEDISART